MNYHCPNKSCYEWVPVSCSYACIYLLQIYTRWHVMVAHQGIFDGPQRSRLQVNWSTGQCCKPRAEPAILYMVHSCSLWNAAGPQVRAWFIHESVKQTNKQKKLHNKQVTAVVQVLFRCKASFPPRKHTTLRTDLRNVIFTNFIHTATHRERRLNISCLWLHNTASCSSGGISSTFQL